LTIFINVYTKTTFTKKSKRTQKNCTFTRKFVWSRSMD